MKLNNIKKQMLCPCVKWARSELSPYPFRGEDGLPAITNHHPKCEHYNDSLIDMWGITYMGSTCYTTEEPDPDDFENGEVITKHKIHREIFDQLPEHTGF
jgi:hypothetical protein